MKNTGISRTVCPPGFHLAKYAGAPPFCVPNAKTQYASVGRFYEVDMIGYSKPRSRLSAALGVDAETVQNVLWRTTLSAGVGVLAAMAFKRDVRRGAAWGAMIGLVFSRWTGR